MTTLEDNLLVAYSMIQDVNGFCDAVHESEESAASVLREALVSPAFA